MWRMRHRHDGESRRMRQLPPPLTSAPLLDSTGWFGVIRILVRGRGWCLRGVTLVGVLDPAPSVYVRGGRGQHRDRYLDVPNRSVAQCPGQIANTRKSPREDAGFGG